MSDHGFGPDTPPPPPPPPKDEGAGGRGGAKDGADNPYEDAGGSAGQETAREETREEEKSGKHSEGTAGDESERLDQDAPKSLPPSDEGAEDQGRLKDGADDPFDDDAHHPPVQETSRTAVDGAEDNDEAATPAPDATETRTEDTETDPSVTDPPAEARPSPAEDDQTSSPPTEANGPSAAKDDAQDPPEKKPDAPAAPRQGDTSTPPGDTDEPGPSEPPDHIPEQRQDPDRTTRPEPDGESASVDGAAEASGESPQSAETTEDADQVPRAPGPEPVETDRSPEDRATAGTKQHTPHARDAPQPSDGAGGTGPDHSAEPLPEPQVPEQPGTPAHPEHSTESRPEGSQQPQRESGHPEGSVPGGSTDHLAAPAVDTDGDAADAGIDAGVEGLGKAAVATVEAAGNMATGLAMKIGAAASEAQADIKPDGGVTSGDNGGVRDEGGDPGEDGPGGDADTGEQSPTDEPEEESGSEGAETADSSAGTDGTGDDEEPEEQEAGADEDGEEESESTEADEDEEDAERNAETDVKIAEFERQGHGPQRHLNPSTEALKARKGEPKFDDNGDAKFKGNGHVETKRHVNPETGRVNDVKANGGTKPHSCGDYATKFESAEDYVKAEQYLREKAEQTGKPKVNATIKEIFGPGSHSEKFEGYYVDPTNPKNNDGTVNHLPVDFHEGRIIAEFNESTGGLHTMYPDPKVGRHP